MGKPIEKNRFLMQVQIKEDKIMESNSNIKIEIKCDEIKKNLSHFL